MERICSAFDRHPCAGTSGHPRDFQNFRAPWGFEGLYKGAWSLEGFYWAGLGLMV